MKMITVFDKQFYNNIYIIFKILGNLCPVDIFQEKQYSFTFLFIKVLVLELCTHIVLLFIKVE